jgi:CBS domain-containing protein
MATVGQLLESKTVRRVFSASPETTVFEATRLMNAERIGALLVVTEGSARGGLVGIFTERDVLRRVVAAGVSPERTRLDEVMTREMITCTVDTTLEEVSELMRVERIRHLPVLDLEQQIAGLISIGDLNAHQADRLKLALNEAENYIHGRV